MRIAVLVSGGGTNLQALIDSSTGCKKGEPGYYEIALVIADRPGIFALQRAALAGIRHELTLPPRGVPRQEARRAVSDHVMKLAVEAGVDALVLAGWLTILAGPIISKFSGRIVNLHPALLPKFGGEGMWGHHVHKAVLAAQSPESGCTVHLVDGGCDTGPILLQKKVPVLPGDTPDLLADRIHAVEHQAIVEGVRILAERLHVQ